MTQTELAVYSFTPRGVRHAVVTLTVGNARDEWVRVFRLACNQGAQPDLSTVVAGVESCKSCARVYSERSTIDSVRQGGV